MPGLASTSPRAPHAPLQIVQLDEERNEFVARGTFEHPYPATKVMWAPEPLARERDLLATSGDYLRLWAVSPSTHGGGGGGDGAAHAGPDVEVKQEALLNNVRVLMRRRGRGYVASSECHAAH